MSGFPASLRSSSRPVEKKHSLRENSTHSSPSSPRGTSRHVTASAPQSPRGGSRRSSSHVEDLPKSGSSRSSFRSPQLISQPGVELKKMSETFNNHLERSLTKRGPSEAKSAQERIKTIIRRGQKSAPEHNSPLKSTALFEKLQVIADAQRVAEAEGADGWDPLARKFSTELDAGAEPQKAGPQTDLPLSILSRTLIAHMKKNTTQRAQAQVVPRTPSASVSEDGRMVVFGGVSPPSPRIVSTSTSASTSASSSVIASPPAPHRELELSDKNMHAAQAAQDVLARIKSRSQHLGQLRAEFASSTSTSLNSANGSSANSAVPSSSPSAINSPIPSNGGYSSGSNAGNISSPATSSSPLLSSSSINKPASSSAKRVSYMEDLPASILGHSAKPSSSLLSPDKPPIATTSAVLSPPDPKKRAKSTNLSFISPPKSVPLGKILSPLPRSASVNDLSEVRKKPTPTPTPSSSAEKVKKVTNAEPFQFHTESRRRQSKEEVGLASGSSHGSGSAHSDDPRQRRTSSNNPTVRVVRRAVPGFSAPAPGSGMGPLVRCTLNVIEVNGEACVSLAINVIGIKVEPPVAPHKTKMIVARTSKGNASDDVGTNPHPSQSSGVVGHSQSSNNDGVGINNTNNTHNNNNNNNNNNGHGELTSTGGVPASQYNSSHHGNAAHGSERTSHILHSNSSNSNGSGHGNSNGSGHGNSNGSGHGGSYGISSVPSNGSGHGLNNHGMSSNGSGHGKRSSAMVTAVVPFQFASAKRESERHGRKRTKDSVILPSSVVESAAAYLAAQQQQQAALVTELDVVLKMEVVNHEGEIKVDINIVISDHVITDPQQAEVERKRVTKIQPFNFATEKRLSEKSLRRLLTNGISNDKPAARRSIAHLMPGLYPSPNIFKHYGEDLSVSFVVPSLLLMRVFGYFIFRDLCMAACVCRQWNIVADSDNLWRPLQSTNLEQIRLKLRRDLASRNANAAAASGAEGQERGAGVSSGVPADEEDTVQVFEPMFPRRWKDAVKLTRTHSGIKRIGSYVPVVIDNGSDSIKSGLASSQLPTLVVSSAIGFPKPRSVIQPENPTPSEVPPILRDNRGRVELAKFPAYLVGDELTPNNPLFDRYDVHPKVFSDNPNNWEDLTTMWAYLFDTLVVDASEHPVLVTQPVLAPTSLRATSMEILFETFGVPAAYVEMAPLLGAYSYGEMSGIVVDIGASSAQVVAIADGSIIEHASRRVKHLGGDRMTSKMMSYLRAQGVLTDPEQNFLAMSVAKRIKEKRAFCAFDYQACLDGTHEVVGVVETLPNRQELFLSDELAHCGEILFSPQQVLEDVDDSIISITQLVSQVVNHVDIDLRSDLVGHIMLSGGVTKMKGFVDRFTVEMHRALPRLAHLNKIAIAADKDRQFAAWSGGAILARCEAFQNSWELKEDYQEHGGSRMEMTD